MIQLNPNLSFGPSFIVGSLTVSDEILNIKIDVFFHIVEENVFKTNAMSVQVSFSFKVRK
jgi:hypothetical protein